jgi:hypothetical protein
VFEPQIRERYTHRTCERRRIHPLDLDAETAAALENQQIELAPKIGFIGFYHFEDLPSVTYIGLEGQRD